MAEFDKRAVEDYPNSSAVELGALRASKIGPLPRSVIYGTGT
jgi:hypothetical protein